MVAGLVSRVERAERVEDWGIESQITQPSNHPILQWRQPYRRRQKNGEINLRIWCGRILAVDLASEDLQKSGKDYCIAPSLVG